MNRRRLLVATATAAVIGIPHRARGGEVVPEPIESADRIFATGDLSSEIAGVSVFVGRYAGPEQAAAVVETLMLDAVTPPEGMEIAIADLESTPLSSIPGWVATWRTLAGAAAFETFHAGVFVWRDELAWSVIAHGQHEEALLELVMDKAHTLLAREEGEGGLIDLLLDTGDLPPGFELASMRHNDVTLVPEGTPTGEE